MRVSVEAPTRAAGLSTPVNAVGAVEEPRFTSTKVASAAKNTAATARSLRRTALRGSAISGVLSQVWGPEGGPAPADPLPVFRLRCLWRRRMGRGDRLRDLRVEPR